MTVHTFFIGVINGLMGCLASKGGNKKGLALS